MRVRLPFRRPDARWRLTPTHLVILLSWAAVFVPRVLSTLSSPKIRLPVGQSPPISTLASSVERGLQLILVATCLLIVLSRVRRLPSRISWSLVVLLLPWAYLVLHDLALGRRPTAAAFLYLAVVMTLWVLQPRLDDLRVAAAAAVVVAVVSVILGATVPDEAILTNVLGEAVAPEKAILPFGILVGPLTSGNNLGQVLAISAPLLLLLPRGWRLPSAAVVLLALLWSASRGSMAAVVAAGVVAVVVSRLQRELRSGAAFVAAGGVLVAIVALPFVTDDDLAFTNRGYIWRQSLAAWQRSPVFGLGSDFYARIGGWSDEIVATAFHGHSQAVQSLVTGGVVLGVLVAVLILTGVVVAARWAGRGQVVPLAFVVALLVSCAFEVSIGFVDRKIFLPVVVVPLAVLLLSPDSARQRTRRQGPQPVQEPAVP